MDTVMGKGSLDCIVTILERKIGFVYIGKLKHRTTHSLNKKVISLIRQYLPKGTSMANLTQRQCDVIANKLNTRPRKRLKFKTPEEYYYA